jgi:ATP-dependent protease ClpP protease subunit
MIKPYYLYGDIGEYLPLNAEEFVGQLGREDFTGVDELQLRINTYGGSVDVAVAIKNAVVAKASELRLKNKKFKVTAIIDGVCYSAGTILMLAADEIYMCSGTKLMIHQPMLMAQGTAEELATQSEFLQKVEKQIIQLYQERTNLTEAELKELMAKETYFTPEEALEKGFIDGVVKETEKPKAKMFGRDYTPKELKEFAKAIADKKYATLMLSRTLTKKEDKEMKLSDIASLMGLPEDTSEEDVKKKVKALFAAFTEEEEEEEEETEAEAEAETDEEEEEEEEEEPSAKAFAGAAAAIVSTRKAAMSALGLKEADPRFATFVKKESVMQELQSGTDSISKAFEACLSVLSKGKFSTSAQNLLEDPNKKKSKGVSPLQAEMQRRKEAFK